MALPSAIRTAVHHSMIGKSAKLFNGSLSEAILELLQNSRRAGARLVEIDLVPPVESGLDHEALRIRDDGSGIDDPATMLTLGASEWDDAITRSEKPAGTGLFSLAGRNVTIRSRSAAAGQGWQVTIAADAWESTWPLEIKPHAIGLGTEILIELPAAWLGDLDAAVRSAAIYYPLSVHFAGEMLERQDFLTGATRIEHWNGCRIGVFHNPDPVDHDLPTINFHGLTFWGALPGVSEFAHANCWISRVEIIDASALGFVPPGHNEIVPNAELRELSKAVEAAIYRTIAGRGHHRLAYDRWRRARDLGVILPEAEPWLSRWEPRTVQSRSFPSGERVAGVPMLLMPPMTPEVEQCAARALGTDSSIGAVPVRASGDLQGYSWYNALPRVQNIHFRVDWSEGSFLYPAKEEIHRPPQSGTVATITLELTIRAATDAGFEIRIERLPADVLIIPDYHRIDDCSDDGVAATILLAADCPIGPTELTNLLEATCFIVREYSDTPETQNREFWAHARYSANQLLFGEDAALIERLRYALQEHVCSLLPKGRTVSIEACGAMVDLRLDERAADTTH